VRLELYIRSRFYISEEITLPEKESWMGFEDNYKAREEYLKLMVKGMKNKYARAIENQEYEIFLIIPTDIFEPELN
jgi:hypothetical protein